MNPHCKGCHKPILWAMTADGKSIPLDTKPPVYEVKKDFTGAAIATRVEGVYVNHFATCPRANDFSSSNKKNTV